MLDKERIFSEWDQTLAKLEEMISHPADITYSSLQNRESATKRDLSKERSELTSLLNSLPTKAPKAGTKESESYLNVQKQIQILKERISKKHDELMEILKNEVKISQEIQKKQ